MLCLGVADGRLRRRSSGRFRGIVGGHTWGLRSCSRRLRGRSVRFGGSRWGRRRRFTGNSGRVGGGGGGGFRVNGD